MKKIIVSILLLVTVVCGAFAADGIDPNPVTNSVYGAMADPYMPMSARMLGMGSAGLAAPSRSDAFLINPAVLGEGKFELAFPYLQLTIYHPYDFLAKGEDGKSLLDNIIHGMGSESGDSMAGIASDLLGLIKAGNGKLMDVDTGVSFTAGGFAFGVFANSSLHTYADVGGLDANMIVEANAVAALGFGHRFELPLDFSLDFGAVVRFNYLGYSQAMGKDWILDQLNGSDPDFAQMFSGISIMAGWSLPIDVGLNLNMPYGLHFAVVARNLNGNFHMAQHTGYEGIQDNPLGNGDEVTRFKLKSDWSLDTGIAWQWDNALFRPTVAVDIVDWVGMFQEPVGLRTFLTHLNIGAEIRLLSFLDLRAGMSQGYFSLGAGLDLWAVKIDMAYYWKEFGETAGDYGLDGFTIRFNIGFDK